MAPSQDKTKGLGRLEVVRVRPAVDANGDGVSIIFIGV